MNFLLIATLLLIVPLSAIGSEVEVTIYVDDAYKPFSFEHNGQAKGMYIDVLTAAFSKMKDFKVTMKPVPWNRGKAMMEHGSGFGLAPAFFHGHDWRYLYPYSLPFYTETIIAVCSEGVLEQERPRWPEGYKGLAIGNVAGFDGWGGVEFRSLVKTEQIRYHETLSSDALIIMLVKKRVDCIMMENRAFDYGLNSLKESGKYSDDVHNKLVKTAVIGTDPVYIGYSESAIKTGKYSYEYSFRKALDVIIYQMIKTGEVERIMDAYLE
jgi:polar amino acid transport system substrate-binding protein